jgi:hypothetical protein
LLTRIAAVLLFIVLLLPLAPVQANTQSFDSAEYKDAGNGDTRYAVEKECNCTGHLVDSTVWQGYAFKAISYDRLGGGEVTMVYRGDTDGGWRLKERSWAYSGGKLGGVGDWSNNLAWNFWCPQFISGSDTCGTDSGGGTGGGGSW